MLANMGNINNDAQKPLESLKKESNEKNQYFLIYTTVGVQKALTFFSLYPIFYLVNSNPHCLTLKKHHNAVFLFSYFHVNSRKSLLPFHFQFKKKNQ